MSDGGTRGMGRGAWARAGEVLTGLPTQSGKARVSGAWQMRLLGEKRKILQKGPRVQGCPGQGSYRSTRVDKEYAVWYTCNNVGKCRSWEVAGRGEWPSGRVTTG